MGCLRNRRERNQATPAGTPNDDVDSELGQHGVTGDEHADAEIDDGRRQPDPNELYEAAPGII